jgi:asparagine synthase (glutamine-hydrolysing)
VCGITGAVGYIDPEIRNAVARMNATQKHRGPDDAGLWASGTGVETRGAILGHTRLSILDVSGAAAQPMVSPDGGKVLVYNGELYNFRDIRAELAAVGMTFRSAGDTEVFFAAFMHWGPAAVEKMRGMFAAALWDGATGRLMLVRDRLGIKPLYVHERRGPNGVRTLIFASELRSLLASGLVDRRLDPTGLATFLWNGFVAGETSIVRDVRLFPEASIVTLEAGKGMPAPRRYWHLPSGRETTTAISGLAAELDRSVHSHLVSDAPLAVFLSGGVDSSVVARLSQKGSDARIRTFSVGFDEAAYDETRYAEAVAAQIGSDHTTVRLTQADFAAALPKAFTAIDQPTFDGINTFMVSRAVAAAGIKVAVAGTGGDEIFGGYRSFRDLPLAARLSGLLGRTSGSAVGALLAAFSGGSGVPRLTRWGKLADVAAAGGDLLGLYQTAYGLFTRRFFERLAPAFRSEVDFGLPPKLAAELRAGIAGEPLLHAVSKLETSLFLGQRLLRDSDAASKAVSVELRVPFVDHMLIEAAARIDPSRRFSPLGRKQLLRDCGLAGLDPALFERPKNGFVMPLERWMRASLQPAMTEAFHDRSLCEAAGLDPATVAALWRAYVDGRPGVYWSRVWSLYVLLEWMRLHEARL